MFFSCTSKLPCKLASRFTKPMDASVSNCTEYRCSGGKFWLVFVESPFIIRAINSENSAGFAWADGAVELVVFVFVLVFEVVVDELVVEAFEVAVKPDGGGGTPIFPTKPGAAERNCSIPKLILLKQ